jgi:hypothetical protein
MIKEIINDVIQQISFVLRSCRKLRCEGAQQHSVGGGGDAVIA